jgi:hypothetical protein
MNNALSHNGTSWLIPARPGSARRRHRPQTTPPRRGQRHSPCSGWVPSQRLLALAGPGGCRGPGCSVRRYVAWLQSAETGPQACSGRLMTPGAGWRGASESIHMYQHLPSLARKSSGTMAQLPAQLVARPVVRLAVARPVVRLAVTVARPVVRLAARSVITEEAQPLQARRASRLARQW